MDIATVVPVSKIVSKPVLKEVLEVAEVMVQGNRAHASARSLIIEANQDRIIWKIAEKVEIVGEDATIDLDKHRTKFFEIDKFVKDVDKNFGQLPEKYQTEKKYKEWYEIYRKESM